MFNQRLKLILRISGEKRDFLLLGGIARCILQGAHMRRTARASAGGLCFHKINRGNARAEMFRKLEDCVAFHNRPEGAAVIGQMLVLAHCLKAASLTHSHLARGDGNLSRFMQWRRPHTSGAIIATI